MHRLRLRYAVRADAAPPPPYEVDRSTATRLPLHPLPIGERSLRRQNANRPIRRGLPLEHHHSRIAPRKRAALDLSFPLSQVTSVTASAPPRVLRDQATERTGARSAPGSMGAGWNLHIRTRRILGSTSSASPREGRQCLAARPQGEETGGRIGGSSVVSPSRRSRGRGAGNLVEGIPCALAGGRPLGRSVRPPRTDTWMSALRLDDLYELRGLLAARRSPTHGLTMLLGFYQGELGPHERTSDTIADADPAA
jgi:hypothetical protein